MDNQLLAKLIRQGGSKLLDAAVDRILPPAGSKVAKVVKKPAPKSALKGKVMAQIARRSVPAAIIITGGLLAKHLYDRRRGSQ